MRHYTICFLFILLFLSACNNNSPKSPFDFPANGKPIFDLTSTKTYLPQLIIPFKIDRKDSFLIIRESSRLSPDKPPIHIINQHDLSYYMSKGVLGYGPNEIADAHVYDPGFSDSTFWVNSVVNKRISEFSLYDTSSLSSFEFRQPPSMQLVTKLLLSPDSTFLGHLSADAYNFVSFDKKGNRIKGYGLKEPIGGMLNDGSITNNFLIAQVNKGLFKRDPYSNIYVKASLYTDRIDIFDYDTKEVFKVFGPRLEVPAFKIVGSGANLAPAFTTELDYGHREICFSQEYIYDLYGGYSEKDYRQTEVLAKTIYILTKKGEMVAKLNLDRSLISFTVNEELGKIYGITTDEDRGIAVFDIPKELLNKQE
ncbi:BF3164 family lipoprotein [Roseivirga echinicomitans]